MKVFNRVVLKKGMMMTPQHYSINDGQGIRTVLFLAGCPLRCQWCGNPESYVTRKDNPFVRGYSLEEIEAIIEKQAIFYRLSGGGITFSGGEPTVQREFLDILSEKFYDQGYNLSLETCAYFDFSQVKVILDRMDLIFVDLKGMDEKTHYQGTGLGNAKILDNIKRMGACYDNIVIRIPVIEGMNATEDNIHQTAQFVKEAIGRPKIELLPYHTFGDFKYEQLNMEKPSKLFRRPSEKRMAEFKMMIEAVGVRVVSYL